MPSRTPRTVLGVLVDAPADRLVEVRFALVGDRFRTEVHDAGTGRPSARSAGPDEERGRGLLLVDGLAERWGCRPRAGGVGTFVWALVAPSPSPVPPSALTPA
ncbi:ATP-binding protein [Kitasatospora sp. NPDC093550]|uniref:ATP-binding protein n=1 Tax=Kitasatospora sp. NPDC093550 TaxID=3364089 RepID=UPI0037F84EB6